VRVDSQLRYRSGGIHVRILSTGITSQSVAFLAAGVFLVNHVVVDFVS
jgi:hypothetical protein